MPANKLIVKSNEKLKTNLSAKNTVPPKENWENVVMSKLREKVANPQKTKNAKYISKYITKNRNKCPKLAEKSFKRSIQSDKPPGLDLYERAVIKRTTKEKKVQEHIKECAIKEMKGVTFSPEISNVSKKIMSKKPKTPVENRLLKYINVSSAKKDVIINEVLEEYLENCTFVPQINSKYF